MPRLPTVRAHQFIEAALVPVPQSLATVTPRGRRVGRRWRPTAPTLSTCCPPRTATSTALVLALRAATTRVRVWLVLIRGCAATSPGRRSRSAHPVQGPKGLVHHLCRHRLRVIRCQVTRSKGAHKFGRTGGR